MESNAPLTKALACRATQEQELITQGQLEIIQSFLSIGNENSSLTEYVLETTGQEEEIWNQMLIFLALISFRPETAKLPPPLRIDEVWHKFILCTREYNDFCQKAAGRYLHHVPDSLSWGNVRPVWFENWEKLTKFLDEKVDWYDKDSWVDPEGFEIMDRDTYESNKEIVEYVEDIVNDQTITYLIQELYSRKKKHSRSNCDSCGERCAD